MGTDPNALDTLIAKEQIRELVLLYSRGVDRKDIELLRTLYTSDATDDHGPHFSGSADDYIAFLERSLPHMRYSGHHVCNHLISVNGAEAEGEVYAIAYHIIPDFKGGMVEDLACVRYVDRYRREEGRWLFAARVVEFDMRSVRSIPAPEGDAPDPNNDPSVTTLSSRLFARGPRA
ncbi:MAG: nuclear transport factor 2 family protein [Halioglobus sp.]|nr:nuclear transport factor 2 family protein [Halioglobus sp.]